MARKRGRPTKLNQKAQDAICSALQLGATYDIAANFAGVCYETFNRWINTGTEAHQQLEADPDLELSEDVQACVSLYLAVMEANAGAAIIWLQKIEQASQVTPQWAAWMLERRFPKGYGRPAMMQVEHTGQIDTSGEQHHYLHDFDEALLKVYGDGTAVSDGP